jgi:hypothetical protein
MRVHRLRAQEVFRNPSNKTSLIGHFYATELLQLTRCSVWTWYLA